MENPSDLRAPGAPAPARIATDGAWARPVEDVCGALAGDLTRGLSHDDAGRRLERHGTNELEASDGRSVIWLAVGQFANTMILVLVAAGAITFFIGERTDSVVILVIILLNAAVGFVQEFRAERAMEELHRMTTTMATVVRDGAAVEIPASDVVPGDLVQLAAGAVVPADLRVTEAHDVRIDEAPLTGESEPVAKTNRPLSGDPPVLLPDRVNMAFKGTAVAHGRGRGIVVATGMATEIGRIAGMLHGQGARTTPLQRRLAALGRRMAAAAVVVCLVVFLTGLLRGEPVESMFITAVSLAVAAIPEGLPAVVTVALALGARRMANRRALVRRLPAVETLGSVTVICTDKTGTLTQNRMAVEQVWTPAGVHAIRGVGYDPIGDVTGLGEADPHLVRLAEVAAACTDAVLHAPAGDGPWTLVGDPTEGALLAMAARVGVDLDADGLPPRVAEIPFDAGRRRMSTVHRRGEGWWVATKGALDALAPLVREADRPAVEAAHLAAADLAAQGYRILALADRVLATAPDVARDDIERDLRLLGIVGIADPPRLEVAEAIARCHLAGVTPVMITGDHPATAGAIARRLGMLDGSDDSVLTGSDLDRLSEAALDERVERVRVYARTSPEQKLRIVDAWRRRGAIVAMTGDGVNDAPALRRADIGVAMGIMGSDVSKEAADLVLADDNFATIVRAVEEGRRIYDNIRRFVRYLLTTNSGEVLLMLVAPLLGLPVPLTAAQILWVNLVTDGLPAIVLGLEPVDTDAMERPPRPPEESILGRGLWQHAVWVGVLMATIVIVMQATTRSIGWPWPTMVFSTVAFLQLGHALGVRSETRSLRRIGLLTNPWLAGAVVTSIALQLATIYVPALNNAFDTVALSVPQLAVVLVASCGALVAVELDKWLRRRLTPEPPLRCGHDR